MKIIHSTLSSHALPVNSSRSRHSGLYPESKYLSLYPESALRMTATTNFISYGWQHPCHKKLLIFRFTENEEFMIKLYCKNSLFFFTC
ncbi:MAG TPA: hypothetical protein PLZ29_04575 [Spirochaetota bacterium]|nr:hypothetical protein [Spirochaetota bacterium]